MSVTAGTSRTPPSKDPPKPPPRPACPFCNGTLIELRGQLRCARCFFTLCEGCGGGMAEDCGAVR